MDDKLKEIEANLLRQEHRLIPALLNFFRRKSKYPDKDDPRREAVCAALLWNLFCSYRVMATGGGILALITALLLYQQNELLKNSLFPKPRLTAILRPMVVKADQRPSNELSPDLGIEGRKFEMSFAADGGPFLIDVVNLIVTYADKGGTVIRKDYFESKSKTSLPQLEQKGIEQTDVIFTRVVSEIPPHSKDFRSQDPTKVHCELSVQAIDSKTQGWLGTISAPIRIIKSGEASPLDADLFLDAKPEQLRVDLTRIPSSAPPKKTQSSPNASEATETP